MKLQLGRLSVVRHQWIFFLIFVVVLYVVVRVTQAQEILTTPEPTAVPVAIFLATLVPTDERLLQVDILTATPPIATEPPIAQTDIPTDLIFSTHEATFEVTDVTELSDTPGPLESIMLPTDALSSTLISMDEAIATSTLVDLDMTASATESSEIMMLTPAIEMEFTLMPVATDLLIEIPTMMSTTSEQFHISGQIQANIPLRQTTLIIRDRITHQLVAVQSNDTFSADLPAGDYQFIFTAIYCLPSVIPITLSNKPLRLPVVTLTCGDIDQNSIIDMKDALLVAQNFGFPASLTSSSVDLNVDGVVNIYDLALVSANMHPNQ